MLISRLFGGLCALSISFLAPSVLAEPPKAYKQDPEGHHAPVAVQSDDFIRVDGLRLRDSHGRQHYLTGMNYWACMNLAADKSEGGDYDRLITELDQMQAVGINHLRIMASSEGSPKPQPFRMNPPLMPSPGKYNEKIFVGLDRCLDEMAKRGMRATMTLNDQWQWSGGFAQYISWAHGNEAIEYPPSWNLSAPPQRTDCHRCGWGDYTTAGDWNAYVTYGNQIYTNEEAETWFKGHIRAVLDRKNTVNGRVYKNDATIMTWEPANEPQPAVASTYLDSRGLQLPPNPDDPLLPWIARISSYIKRRAPDQLVTTGFEGKQGEW
jgi:mannan endo-1,4-beta-mannosidase